MFSPFFARRSSPSSIELRALTRPFITAALGAFALAAAQSANAQEAKLPAPQETIPVLEMIPARTPEMLERARQTETQSSLPADVKRAAAASERSHVEYDAPGDGSVWARGAGYKVGFSAQGTAYAPFLGSNAPRDYPVTFRVAHVSVGDAELAFDTAAPALRDGDQVRYERGACAEVYDLALGSMEQSFVFTSLPERGELVVRVSATTELVGRECLDGLEFANDRGAVRYGRATAIDANGARVDAATALTEQGIEIRVPADFVASARLPLTIDPVVSTFNIDTSLIDSYFPDVAYDSTTDRWFVVYEEYFSTTDHDVRYQLLNATGATITSGYVEVSISLDWRVPAVANNALNNQFLIVAQVSASATMHQIDGRIFLADTALFQAGGSFGISGSGQPYDMINPDVGGSNANHYCVVWERVFSGTDRDILYRTVSPQGFGDGTGFQLLDNSGSTVDTVPSISKTNIGGKWNVAYQRTFTQSRDIRGGRINGDGTLPVPTFPVEGSPVDTANPSASPCLNGADVWAIAYERDFGSDWDIGVIYMNGDNATENVNLSGFELISGASPNIFQNQLSPDIDSDGTSFAIVYSESVPNSATDRNLFVSTMGLTGVHLNLSEGHKILAGSFTAEDHPAIASKAEAGGPLRRYFAIWDNLVDPAIHANIEGGLYDGGLYTSFCHPTWDAASCPCGNPASGFGRGCNNSQNTGGAQLSLLGISSLSSDTLSLFGSQVKSNALSVFNQANAVLASSLPFGQGQRCVGGSIKRLYTKPALAGGTVNAPQGGDSNVHTRSSALGDTILPGTMRFYYIYYRDPVVLGGCASTSTFNATQAVQAIWIP